MILMDNMQNFLSPKKQQDQGFTLLYSLIISSLILATVLSIVNVALKQKAISGFARQSQTAFYAANSGMECALYWAIHGRNITTTSGSLNIPIFKIPRDNGVAWGSQYDSPLTDGDDDAIAVRADGGDPDLSINCFGQNIMSGSSVYGFDTQYDFPDSWFDGLEGSSGTVGATNATLDQLCGEAFVDGSGIAEEDYRVWLFRVVMPKGAVEVDQDNPCAEVSVCRRLDTADLSISSRGYNTCNINSESVVERAVRLIQL